MTDAGGHDRLTAMRILATLAFAVAAACAVPAQAACDAPVPAVEPANSQPIIPGSEAEPLSPTPLAELAADSPWRARFEAAADALFPALQSRDPARWQPLLGGRWLGAGEKAAVAALLADRCGVFAPIAAAGGPVARRIMGWQLPAAYSPAERAEIAARPEAEALVCWSAARVPRWPRIAAEADNTPGRPYACARIAYSVRDAAPRWRAFVETP